MDTILWYNIRDEKISLLTRCKMAQEKEKGIFVAVDGLILRPSAGDVTEEISFSFARKGIHGI